MFGYSNIELYRRADLCPEVERNMGDMMVGRYVNFIDQDVLTLTSQQNK